MPTLSLGELSAVAPPLGDLFDGVCAADTRATIEPQVLRRCCNFGYARGQCERATQAPEDAARFAVKGREGEGVVIAWALERDHHPVAVGKNVVDPASVAAPAGDPLTGQIRACARAYLRQTGYQTSELGPTGGFPHPKDWN